MVRELQPPKLVPFKEPQKLGIVAESLKDLPGRLFPQRGVEASRVHANFDWGGPLWPRYGFHLGKQNRTTITISPRARRCVTRAPASILGEWLAHSAKPGVPGASAREFGAISAPPVAAPSAKSR